MKRITLYAIILFIFCGCDTSKWETISGTGIDDEPKSIDNVIYFEDEHKGVVGGYTLISDPNAQNDFKLSTIPALYLTGDGGKSWEKIHFDTTIKESVRNAYLSQDTLICQTDSLVLFSKNKGQDFIILTDSIERSHMIRRYLKNHKYSYNDARLYYKGTEYSIKEQYKNQLASVIVCHGPETMTDYYFVSFDRGKSWTFLQKDFGDNRQRFLLENKFLLCYQFPFGLQRLHLK